MWRDGAIYFSTGATEQKAINLTRNPHVILMWAARCDGRWRYEVRSGGFQHQSGGVALVFSVAPTKILGVTKGHFSQPRHRSDLP